MPKVYIPNMSSHDYSAANQYGDLTALTKGNLDLLNVSAINRQICPILKESSSDDYILISGAAVVNAIACSIFAALHGKLNLLIFRRNGRYVERNINLQ